MSFYELFDIVVYEAIKNQSLYSLVAALSSVGFFSQLISLGLEVLLVEI